MKITARKKAKAARIRKIGDQIRRRADWSSAILGMGFVRHGSGQFLNLRPVGQRIFGRPACKTQSA